jgi:hypothetical protein
MEQSSAKPPGDQPPREQDYSLSSPSPSRSSQRPNKREDDDDSLLSEVEVGDGDDRKIVRYKYVRSTSCSAARSANIRIRPRRPASALSPSPREGRSWAAAAEIAGALAVPRRITSVRVKILSTGQYRRNWVVGASTRDSPPKDR